MEGSEPEPCAPYAAAPIYPLPTASAVRVDYPGFVANTDKVLESLGHARGDLARTLEGKRGNLDFWPRPHDSMSHPVEGNCVPASALLLRVRKPIRRSGQPPVTEQDCEISVVARLDKAHKFDGMSDFQYLGDLSRYRGTSDLGQRFIDQVVSDDAEAEHGKPGQVLDLGPPKFSRTDTPRDYAYKPNPYAKGNRNGEMAGMENQVGRRAGKHATPANSLRNVAVDYLHGDPILAAPPPGIGAPGNDERQQKLVDLFAERPIWSRLALRTAAPEVNTEALKKFLPCVACYFVNGPWRLLWCRYGFDPHTNFSARRYQMIDFRMPRGLEPAKMLLRPTEVAGDQKKRRNRKNASAGAAAMSTQGRIDRHQEQLKRLAAVRAANKSHAHTFEGIPASNQVGSLAHG